MTNISGIVKSDRNIMRQDTGSIVNLSAPQAANEGNMKSLERIVEFIECRRRNREPLKISRSGARLGSSTTGTVKLSSMR